MRFKIDSAVSAWVFPMFMCAVGTAHAATWENAFGNQDLDAVVNLVQQENDSARRLTIEQAIASSFSQDDSRALYVTGALEVAGGVPEIARDAKHGVRLIQTAAQRGVIAARVKLAVLIEAGDTTADPRQARAWLDQSAGTSGAAAYADALLWADGLGGTRNACQANRLLMVAQRQNVNPDGQLQQHLAQTRDACNDSTGGSAGQRPIAGNGISADEWSKIMQLRAPQAPTVARGSDTPPNVPMASITPANANAPDVPVAPHAALTPAANPGANAQSGVAVGVPADSRTLNLDKLLAQLAYAVYSDPDKLAAAQQKVDELQARAGRVQSDPTLDPLVKPHELRKITDTLQAASLKLAELRNQDNVKTTAIQTYGLQRVRLPSSERDTEAGHVYFEAWALPDGRRIIVFRGTDNNADIVTDAQIGLTPELAGELAARVKSLRGQAMLTGMSDLAVKGYQDGHLNVDDIGRPRAFTTADNLVRAVIRDGVPANQVIVTGHSLGGGYSQYAGLRNRVGQIVTFNPAPLNARQQADTQAGLQGYTGQVRHYVSFIALQGSASGGVYDPVSQLTSEYLHQPDLASLRVIGAEYAVPVCADLRSPEYQAFARNVQNRITQKTFASMDHGGDQTKKVGKVIGQLDGLSSASSDRKEAMNAGGDMGQVPGRALGTASYCVRHPYLCSGKFALGGIASAMAMDFTPRAWTVLSAHRMRNLEEAIQQDGRAACVDPSAQVAGQ